MLNHTILETIMVLYIHMRNKGFTLVEILVVIILISLLAAISVAAYSGINTRANTAKISTDLNTVQKIASLHSVEDGSYPQSGNATSMASFGSELEKMGIKSPYDNSMSYGRIGTSPLCDIEPNYFGNNSGCAGYQYLYFSQGTGISNTGLYGSGCSILATNGPSMVIIWYDKPSNTVKFRAQNPSMLTISVSGVSQVYPNQQCVFS